tara:strand:- start:4196 stop:4999 length:804 start_codon:yes stop_codon:yes gene_type:complete
MFLDDFFWRAVIAGIGISIVAGPLGCFVIWKRMSYLGDTMAHSALLGVAIGIFIEINIILGVFAVAICVGFLLFIFQSQKQLPNDAILGTLSHASLAIGVLVISTMYSVRIDFMSFLFGDILSVSKIDLYFIFGGGLVIFIALFWLWKPLIAITFDNELAQAEGIPVIKVQIFFMIMIAAIIALSIKIIGILLVTSLLIIPVSTARRFSKTPEQMAIGGSLIGILSVWLGLETSFQIDTPSGPSIVIVAVIFFLISNFFPIKKINQL